MEIDTVSAFAGAAIAAVVGFGAAFYVASKANRSYTSKGSRALNLMAAASVGYGITAIVNEVFGKLFMGLPMRSDHIALIALANFVVVPGVLVPIGRLVQKRSKARVSDSEVRNETVDRDHTAEIEDECWEAAAKELDGARNQAVWARAYSEAYGDEAKARAIYIGLRASRIQSAKSDSGGGVADASNALLAPDLTGHSVLQDRRAESLVIVILILLLGVYLIKQMVISPRSQAPSGVAVIDEKYWEDGGKKYRLGAFYQRNSGVLGCEGIAGDGSVKMYIAGDQITIGNRTLLSISQRTPETIFFYGKTSDGKSSVKIDVNGFIDLRDGVGQITTKSISGNSDTGSYIFKCSEQ